MTRSYTLYGKGESSYDDWINWIYSAELICNLLGFKSNFYSIYVKGDKSYNFKQAKNAINKIHTLKENNHEIINISIYVLPENYKTLAFDFIITLSRNFGYAKYITLIANDNYGIVLDDDKIINKLNNNITATRCEIYEMDIEECPEMYASGVINQKNIKSLNILKTFQVS